MLVVGRSMPTPSGSSWWGRFEMEAWIRRFACWLVRWDYPLSGKYAGRWHLTWGLVFHGLWPRWQVATVAYNAVTVGRLVLYLPRHDYGDD